MSKFAVAARKALATFLFATLGALSSFAIMDLDVAAWQTALGTGVGALLNLVYRWSESVVQERRTTNGG